MSPTPLSPARAAFDILMYCVASAALYGIEEGARASGLVTMPAAFEGAFSLVAGLFVVLWLLRRRGQRLADIGLRRPERWREIPLWGLAVIAANFAAQLLILAPLSSLFGLPEPDLSRYDTILSKLWIFVPTMLGTMFTGGFIEEVIYRGFFVDRVVVLLGPGRARLWIAALLSGIPFGLIHFEWGLGGILATALMGSLLGAVFVLTKRNLWPLIAGHATLDCLMLTSLYFNRTSL